MGADASGVIVAENWVCVIIDSEATKVVKRNGPSKQ